MWVWKLQAYKKMEQCGVSFAVTLNEPSAELNALRAAGVEDEAVLPDLVRKASELNDSSLLISIK